jgi:micrococcal nuclease
MYEYAVHSVARIVDGDTVDLIIDCGFGILTKQRVRLDGLDAPETSTRNKAEKALGLESKSFVAEWFKKNTVLTVRTRKDANDKYGRFLASVFSGSECLNEIMIRDGWAWAYDGGTKTGNLKTLVEARNAAKAQAI